MQGVVVLEQPHLSHPASRPLYHRVRFLRWDTGDGLLQGKVQRLRSGFHMRRQICRRRSLGFPGEVWEVGILRFDPSCLRNAVVKHLADVAPILGCLAKDGEQLETRTTCIALRVPQSSSPLEQIENLEESTHCIEGASPVSRGARSFVRLLGR